MHERMNRIWYDGVSCTRCTGYSSGPAGTSQRRTTPDRKDTPAWTDVTFSAPPG
jgi:hypothetical protein